MPAAISAHKLRKDDIDKFEQNARAVDKLMAKSNLTLSDLLMGAMYNVSRERWEGAVGTAREWCVNYDVYFNVDPEETQKKYGEE